MKNNVSNSEHVRNDIDDYELADCGITYINIY